MTSSFIEKIKTFLKNNPAPFDVCFVKHGFHRAVSIVFKTEFILQFGDVNNYLHFNSQILTKIPITF